MSYLERIQADLTAAMKTKDELRLSTLRMVKSALKNKEIEKIRPLDDLESLQVLQTLVKQRRESVEQFVKVGPQRPGGQRAQGNCDYRSLFACCPHRCGNARCGGRCDCGIGREFIEADGRGGESGAREAGRQVGGRQSAERPRTRTPHAEGLDQSNRNKPSRARPLEASLRTPVSEPRTSPGRLRPSAESPAIRSRFLFPAREPSESAVTANSAARCL